MEELMRKNQPTLSSFKKGDMVKGTLTKLSKTEVLVDINAKTEAVVLERDKTLLRTILSTFKVGDVVTVQVLDPESDLGNPVVSLRRYLDSLSWEKLEKLKETKEQIEGSVTETTRGGFVVETKFGASGFLPNSQTAGVKNPNELLGQTVKISVLETDRPNKKIIFSQRKSVSGEDFQKATKDLKIGQKISAVVTNVASFGVFVSLPIRQDQREKDGEESEKLDGLIHVSEVAWEKTEDLSDKFHVGESLEAVIIGFDKEAKRVDLSLKKLTRDPFEEISKNFIKDKKVKGKVTKISDIGISLQLDPSTTSGQAVEGLIRKDKIPPQTSYSVGDEIEATVVEVDKRRRRVLLAPVLVAKPLGYR